MDIDYALILETANRRKNALKQIETLIDKAPGILQEALNVRGYYANLEATWKVLDAEGRNLLPAKVVEALSTSPAKRHLADQILGNIPGNTSYHNGLMQLAPFASTASAEGD